MGEHRLRFTDVRKNRLVDHCGAAGEPRCCSPKQQACQPPFRGHRGRPWCRDPCWIVGQAPSGSRVLIRQAKTRHIWEGRTGLRIRAAWGGWFLVRGGFGGSSQVTRNRTSARILDHLRYPDNKIFSSFCHQAPPAAERRQRLTSDEERGRGLAAGTSVNALRPGRTGTPTRTTRRRGGPIPGPNPHQGGTGRRGSHPRLEP